MENARSSHQCHPGKNRYSDAHPRRQSAPPPPPAQTAETLLPISPSSSWARPPAATAAPVQTTLSTSDAPPQTSSVRVASGTADGRGRWFSWSRWGQKINRRGHRETQRNLSTFL